MEDNLQDLPKIRTRFRGTVESISTDPNPEKARILIKDIKLLVSGRKVIYAQDFYYSYRFRKQNLKQGDPVEFDARIRPDKRGVSSGKIRLNYPTKIYKQGPDQAGLFPEVRSNI
ncbi:hypothetical protein [Leptospira licerasiae]|uniref:Uncharacterized protein n=1 Tax=Leptospira licerasiae str. MMD4847 TaxID=1049971 RepID=A0ABN0H640_9LEPT|nr:hypothetical protein [Leptospira licerasiae]EIE02687.1 hypothetical protein LEP1GSC185_1802 [Leptospira licerasiae serovar Varillal str. VAR 010]EJZ41012.1 hypothetical protein LEP1GSC178_1069 [Leptospira licerasiae str. MMD4847]